MFFRPSIFLVFFTLITSVAHGEYYLLPSEPTIRIGLSTNASAVTIMTTDSELVAYSPDEPSKYLATTRVAVSARSYQPPTIENYRFEIQNIETSAEADAIAKDVREATGETAIVSIDVDTNKWKIWIGSIKGTTEEADGFKAMLVEKGFEDAVQVTEKKIVPSEDAIALSQQ